MAALLKLCLYMLVALPDERRQRQRTNLTNAVWLEDVYNISRV